MGKSARTRAGETEIATRAAATRCRRADAGGCRARHQAAEAQVVPPLPANPVPQGSPVPRVLPPAPPSVAPGTVMPAAVRTGRRGAEPAGAGHQRRGRGRHRLSAAGDRTAGRRPGRAGGAAAADRRRAPGDPAALPRRRLCAHHRLGQPRRQRHGCASWSPRGASPASSSTATSARRAPRCCASSTG